MLFVNEAEAQEISRGLGYECVNGHWTNNGYWADVVPISQTRLRRGQGVPKNKADHIVMTGFGSQKAYVGKKGTVYFESEAHKMTKRTAESKARALTRITGINWTARDLKKR